MRIHYTAESWQGGFYHFFGEALKHLGHDVFYFDQKWTPSQYFSLQMMSRIPKMHYRAQMKFRQAVTRDWLASIESAPPDLVIVDHSANLLPDAFEKVQRSGVKIFYWLTSPAWGSNAADMLLSILHADKIFTIERHWTPTIVFDFKPYIHLPLAGDPDAFHPIDAAAKNKRYDATYLGSMPPQGGDGVCRAFVMSKIPSKYHVAVFGHGAKEWESAFPILKERIKEDRIFSVEEVNKIYNESKIMMNIHGVYHISSLSARTFEIGLSGAFQLLEYREDLDTMFPKGLIPSYRTISEMNSLLDQWLSKDKERENRSKEIREHILANHTWTHRAKEMLGYL